MNRRWDVIVVGGHDGDNDLRTCDGYDVKNNSWSPIANMGSKRNYAGIAPVSNGRILAIGGQNGKGNLNS